MNHLDEIESENRSYIEGKIELYKRELTEKLSSIVPLIEFHNDFLNILIYAWQEDLPSAQNIMHKINIREIHLYAFEDAYDFFKDEYLRECDHERGEMEAMNIEDYEDRF